MSDQALLKVLATIMASVSFLVAVAQAQEACPHEIGWTPTKEMLKQVLSDHRQWVERWDKAGGSDEWTAQNPQGRANLCNANLDRADLSEATLKNAELNNANLRRAYLSGATLSGAKLNNAILSEAHLSRANLSGVSLTNWVGLIGTDLSGTLGLPQFRDLLQKAALREEERYATYAIERERTGQASAAEGLFRIVAFELPTAYGLYPGQALRILFWIWVFLIPVYSWPIRSRTPEPTSLAGIYRIWPAGRVELQENSPAFWPPGRADIRESSPVLQRDARVERLHGSGFVALLWAAWFSLLSAFHIGFREFSVGTWLSRVHPRQFALEPTGWVRTVSGLQSLFSLYLLAMWVLTYFGRPFQ